MTSEIDFSSLEDTLAFAGLIGSKLRGGEVIELVSDLGGGKTTFVKGLAKGMSITEQIHSPSFTVSNQYTGQNLTLYHFDFYRLQEPGIIRNELAEIIDDPHAVIAIEWGDIVEDVLPARRLKINITSTGETQRHLKLQYPQDVAYLLEDNT